MDRMSECCGAQGCARATVPVMDRMPTLMGMLRFTHPTDRSLGVKLRVKSKWSNKGRERTLDETGGAVAFILWRIAQQ